MKELFEDVVAFRRVGADAAGAYICHRDQKWRHADLAKYVGMTVRTMRRTRRSGGGYDVYLNDELLCTITAPSAAEVAA
jgi:hypothetical protein